MSITYYQDEHGGYLGVTSESPQGFRGIVFVGRGPEPGGGPETVHEQAYATDQLGRLERVVPCDVPAEWMEVIGYEEPENGVHPARLKLVSDLFKNAQETFKKQIIVNTHSPVFPTYFEDRLLFVCRKEGPDTQVLPFRSAGPLFRKKDIAGALEERILRGDYGG